MSVKIVTDSTSYISEKIRNEHNISVVSLNIAFKDISFKEVDIDNDTFYKRIEEKGEFPKSSQPSVGEMYETFLNLVKENNDIVGIFISSDMSGTYSSAFLAKNMVLKEYPNAKIEIVDSRSNCMQLGFSVIEAAKEAKKGSNIKEVVKAAKDNINRSRFLFIPNTLDYLAKGGRIGEATALLGKVLKITPILTVTNGETTIFNKVRTKKKAIMEMINTFLKDIKKFQFGNIVIHHIDCEEEAKEIAKTIKGLIGKEIKVCPIGPVIGSHVGPGAIGLAYYTMDELDK